jgi:hypothetical protein
MMLTASGRTVQRRVESTVVGSNLPRRREKEKRAMQLTHETKGEATRRTAAAIDAPCTHGLVLLVASGAIDHSYLSMSAKPAQAGGQIVASDPKSYTISRSLRAGATRAHWQRHCARSL